MVLLPHLPLLDISAAADGLADGSGERRTSPVNGIARSFTRAKVPKTKYLPVFAITFPTPLFCKSRRDAYEGHPLSKLFSKAETLPFEKEININLIYSPCLKHAQEMLLGDQGQADQRTQSFHLPIVIHQSLDPAARALKLQAPCLLHALEHSPGSYSECVDALGLRAVEVSICMITRDFSVITTDVTGVCLSLPLSLLLTKVTHAQFRRRFGVSVFQYNEVE